MNEQLARMLIERLGDRGEGASAGADLRQMMLEQVLRMQGAGSAGAEPDAAKEPQPDPRRRHQALAGYQRLIGYVGEVFGACRTCWGTRESCPSCAGRGGPGTFPVQREAFLAWVTPCLRGLGMALVPESAMMSDGVVTPVDSESVIS